MYNTLWKIIPVGAFIRMVVTPIEINALMPVSV